MDLTQAIIAKSDQLNADDLIGGPQTFTIAEVREGSSEQPVSIVLAEWHNSRPFKPSKTVLRILVHAWGKETDDWPKGARMTLYRAPEVKWAGEEVGGIRVSHLSHIPADKLSKGKLQVALKESQKKKVLWTVDPLPDVAPAPAEPSPMDLAAQILAGLTDATTEAEVREWGNRAHARQLLDLSPTGATGTLREMVQARLAELTTEDDPTLEADFGGNQ